MFHHFHDEKIHMPGQGSIDTEIFTDIIQYLNKNYTILSPNQFIKKLKSKSLKSNDITLTFDDALRCQYDIALPILQKFSIKAFFFIYTNAFNGNPDPLEFYRDLRNNYFDSIDDFYAKFFQLFKKTFPTLYHKFHQSYKDSYLSEFKFYSENDKKGNDGLLGQGRNNNRGEEKGKKNLISIWVRDGRGL